MKSLSTNSAIVAIVMCISMPAFADDEYNVSTGITTAGVPLGLHGVDAVALTTIHDVSEGSHSNTVVVDGVAYYFASPASAQQFEAAPDRYLPRYGGFCAYAVALGKKFDGDPRYADIVDGKLYLFVNEEIYHKYKQDSRNILRKAEQTWPSIRDKAVSDL
ncbi:MAG: YHS domain-containing (seleno)protein [Pseudomonadales bacterium]|jgi:YHS domain-containing protein